MSIIQIEGVYHQSSDLTQIAPVLKTLRLGLYTLSLGASPVLDGEGSSLLGVLAGWAYRVDLRAARLESGLVGARAFGLPGASGPPPGS